jgi:hypothetical protein
MIFAPVSGFAFTTVAELAVSCLGSTAGNGFDKGAGVALARGSTFTGPVTGLVDMRHQTMAARAKLGRTMNSKKAATTVLKLTLAARGDGVWLDEGIAKTAAAVCGR